MVLQSSFGRRSLFFGYFQPIQNRDIGQEKLPVHFLKLPFYFRHELAWIGLNAAPP